MKIGIVNPMTLGLLDFDFKDEYVPESYAFLMISNIINFLKAIGHEIVAYTTSWDVKEMKVFKNEGFTICVCPKWRNTEWNFFKFERTWLEKVMRECPSDIINTQWSCEFGIVARASGIPTVVKVRDHATTILKYERCLFALTRWWMDRMAMKREEHFMTNSDYLYKLLPSKTQNNARVVSNFFKEVSGQNFEENQEKENYITSIANLSNRRNNLTGGVQAFHLLKKKYPNIKYYLVGKGSEPNGWIYEYAKKNQMLDGLEFIGSQLFSKFIQFIKKAKLLLHPSREDSLGSTVLEVMMVGTPVVGGEKSGNIPYLLDFSNTGLACDINQPEEMAEAMGKVLDDKQIAYHLRKKAYQFALDNFSQKVVTDKLVQYCKGIISQINKNMSLRYRIWGVRNYKGIIKINKNMSLRYRIWGVRKIALNIENKLFNIWFKNKLENKVNIFGFPFVFIPKGAQVKVGKGIRLISHSYFSEPGISHPVMIRLLNKNAKLTIGNNVGISGGGICVQTEVIIGDNVMFGANAFVSDTDFHPIGAENRRYSKENIGSKPVQIGNNVFLGMNTIVLKGVTIGDNSIVAAGSIVVKDIPENQIWGGNPAKYLRDL